MNELKIEFSNESYLYYKTTMKTAATAFDEWEQLCDRMRMDVCNMIVTEVVLRDEEFNDIDKMEV